MQPQPWSDAPSAYHITTWKAGSTWVQGILLELDAARVLIPPPPVADGLEFMEVERGRIYSPLYLNRIRFMESPFAQVPHRKFVVLRDLRDTLVSCYFSLAKTHDENPVVLAHRARLAEMSKEDGLIYFLSHPDFFGLSIIFSTWMTDPETLLVRFESLIEEPHLWFRKILDQCEIEASDEALSTALSNRSFENLAGRPRGVEGQSHFRRGIAGDWRNHFTARVAEEFAHHFDDLLTKNGYPPTTDLPASHEPA